jgi:hypothetical protein
VPFPQGGASAACAESTFTEDRIVLTREGEQTVAASGLSDGCEDSESCGPGCAGCEVDDPAEPMEDVELRITQMGRSWSLATVDAGDDSIATWTFDLPAGVEPGKARLLADTVRPMVVTVR